MQMLRSLLIIFTVAAGVAAQTPSGVLPVGPWEHRFLYDRMERTQALSPDRFDYQLGPHRLDTALLSATPFENFATVSGTKLAAFTSAGELFRSIRDSRATGYELLRGGVALRPLEKLFVYGSFILDEARAKDPAYVGKKWRGFAGDVDQAFATWQNEKFDLTVGRFASFWGNQRSLVLGSGVALDGFGYSFRWGKVTVSYRLARLDPLRRNVDSTTQVENRFFAGHRFDFHVSRQLRVGLFETVVFGGPGRQIEFFYLNPLIFFHGSQVNEGANDNTLVGFDVSYKPWLGWHLYGQVIIDDLQIEKKTQSDQEPDEIGFLVGGYVANFIPQTDVRLEYSRVNNWTFNQNLSRNRYLFNNRLISSAPGNDYDLADLAITRWLGPRFAATAHISHYRQGEGSVTAAWSEPWMQVDGKYSEPFPTGIVQSTASFSLGCKGYLRKMLAFDIETGIEQVKNYRHLSSDDRTLPFVQLSVSALFSTIIDMQ